MSRSWRGSGSGCWPAARTSAAWSSFAAPARIRTVLEPIYEALEIDWQPATTGSIALEIGDDDETTPNDRPDPLIERTMTALRTTLSRTYDLIPTTLDDATLALAKELAPTYQPRV